MKIGIIIYSYTGNTLSVGERIKDSLLEKGHSVYIERITAANDNPNSRDGFSLLNKPDPTPYDAVILGGPVQQFGLSRVMRAYLDKLPDMKGKKVSCFVTQGLPVKWMGSNGAIKYITDKAEAKGAIITATGIVHWGSGKRQEQIENVIASVSNIIWS
jgi:flavodoxin